MRPLPTVVLLVVAVAVSGCYGTARGTVTFRTTPQQVVVHSPPPPLRASVSTRPNRPGANAVWVDGHYRWEGGWVWVQGRWVTGRAGYVWVAPVARAEASGRVVYHAGFWRRPSEPTPSVYVRPGTVHVAHRPSTPARGVSVETRPAARQPARGVSVRERPAPAQPAERVRRGPERAAQPAEPSPPARGASVGVQPREREAATRPMPAERPREGSVRVQPREREAPTRPMPAERPREGSVRVQPREREAATRPMPAQPPREGSVSVRPPQGNTPTRTMALRCEIDTPRAPRGGMITITGTGFGSTGTVRIGGQNASIVRRETGRLVVRVDGGGAVSVHVGDNSARCGQLELIQR